MASDTDTATPEPGRHRFGLHGLGSRIAAAFSRRGAAPAPARPAESPSLLRRRRSATRRHSPLTRRILLLNIVPVALLTLGAVYLSDYEEELIDTEVRILRSSSTRAMFLRTAWLLLTGRAAGNGNTDRAVAAAAPICHR